MTRKVVKKEQGGGKAAAPKKAAAAVKAKPEAAKPVVAAKPPLKRPSPATAPRSPTEIWGTKVAMVVSEFNKEFTDKLSEAAIDVFQKAGAQFERYDVPGAFEIAGVLTRLGRSRRYDGLIAIGCVIRGETTHFDLVVDQVREGVGRLASAGDVAVTFGVLAADDRKQAADRTGGKYGNVGREAAEALLKLIPLYRRTAHPALVQTPATAA
ncbi:6,7-dimethyl-8-ribityllumazine synthase [bacterium]|nr:6,7-dimethyl-8-ribityllumazine synthase [bacterium]